MPKIVANEYEKNLQTLTTSLLDYRGRRDYPKSWPKTLNNYQIVVETYVKLITIILILFNLYFIVKPDH